VRALRWDGTRLALARDVPEPRPGPADAVVRVRLAGICRTDLEITRGYLAFRGTLGHEWVGEVVAAGDPAAVGRRVVGEINLACGGCATCATGLGRHCPTRRVLGIVGADGAFADLVVVPLANLHFVPDEVSDRDAVFVEPVAAAFEIIEQLGDVAGRRGIVLGDGKLGLLVAQVLNGAGARVRLVGRHADKLRRARALGIDTGAPVPGADLVVDATGSPDGLAHALGLVRPRGTVVLKTTVAASHQVDLAPAVINEVTIVGSRCGPFSPALAALAAGRLSVAPLVDRVYPLDDGQRAFTHAATAGTLKILLDVRCTPPAP
jgi:threonine dehydrogenase-like Zn-dependent dehydrogenase